MEIKRYVLLKNNKIYDLQNEEEVWAKSFNIVKTSDNILDLVEVGDLLEINEMNGIYYVDSIITDEDGLRVFICDQKYGYWFDFNEMEVKAIYKRQRNGDYKRYEVV